MKQIFLCTIATLSIAASPSLFADEFSQINLVSDVPGMAPVTDSNLKNPWGVSFSSTSPLWVSNQASGNSTLYSGAGAKVALTVSVPSGSGPGPAGPTGQVFNNTSGFLDPSNGNPASFIFATLGGTIDVWNSSNGSTAAIVRTATGAVFTGLAIGSAGSQNYLYAANFTSGGGSINVYDSTFTPTSLAGSFKDPNLPAGYAPYNIQNIGGKLYIEYALYDPTTRQSATGAGLGYVDVFDTSGNLLQRLAGGEQLDAPWGVAIAPSSFASLGGDVLVGNFGNGEINAYNPTTGAWVATLTDAAGNPIVNSGLWAIDFGNSSANPNFLYFTAGINNQADGLFGAIVPTPEPAAWSIAGLGILSLIALRRHRRAR